MDELGDDEVGHIVVHRRVKEHDALVEEPREDIERALAATRLLDHVWNQYTHFFTLLSGCALSSLLFARQTLRERRRVGVDRLVDRILDRLGRGFVGLDFLRGGLIGLGHLHLHGVLGEVVDRLDH